MRPIFVDFKQTEIRNLVETLSRFRRSRYSTRGYEDAHTLPKDLNRELDAIGDDSSKIARFKAERKRSSLKLVYSLAATARERHASQKLHEQLGQAVKEALKAIKAGTINDESIEFVTGYLLEAHALLKERERQSDSDRLPNKLCSEITFTLCSAYEETKARIKNLPNLTPHSFRHPSNVYPTTTSSDEGIVKLPMEYFLVDHIDGADNSRGSQFMSGSLIGDFIPAPWMMAFQLPSGTDIFSDVLSAPITEKAQNLRSFLVSLVQSQELLERTLHDVGFKERELQDLDSRLADARLSELGLRAKDYDTQSEARVREKISQCETEVRRLHSTAATYSPHLSEVRASVVVALRELLEALSNIRINQSDLTREVPLARFHSHALVLVIFLCVVSDQQLRLAGKLLDDSSRRLSKPVGSSSASEDLAQLENIYLPEQRTPMMSAR